MRALRPPPNAVAPVSDVLSALAGGDFALIVDDESPEGIGYLAISADHVSTSQMAYLVRHTSGYVCAAMSEVRAAELDIPLLVPERDNHDSRRNPFGVSVDVIRATTTGISAEDRATTVRALAASTTTPDDLTRPGHVVPLLARSGGVLERRGHAEAGIDLCRLAGCSGIAVLSVVVDDHGDPLTGGSLLEFARRHGMPTTTIGSVADYRAATEPIARRLSSARIPTEAGVFVAHAFGALDGTEHVAFTADHPADVVTAPLVSIHSECPTGDVVRSLRCDCRRRLDESMRAVADSGGAILYLRGAERRGAGPASQLATYELREHGYLAAESDAPHGQPVDARQYADAAAVLRDLGLTSITLLTTDPEQATALARYGITVLETVRTAAERTAQFPARRYKERFGGTTAPLAPTA